MDDELFGIEALFETSCDGNKIEPELNCRSRSNYTNDSQSCEKKTCWGFRMKNNKTPTTVMNSNWRTEGNNVAISVPSGDHWRNTGRKIDRNSKSSISKSLSTLSFRSSKSHKFTPNRNCNIFKSASSKVTLDQLLMLSKSDENENDGDFLLKLLSNTGEFMFEMEQRQNEPEKIVKILMIFVRVANMQRSHILNQFIVTVLTKNFVTSQLMLFISNLLKYMECEGDRRTYLDAVRSLIIFLKFLSASMINYAHDTVKSIVMLLTSQMMSINSHSSSDLLVFPADIVEDINELNKSIEVYESLPKERNEKPARKVDILQQSSADILDEPPDNFRQITAYDTILSTMKLKNTVLPFLRKNIIIGQYVDADHYLDVHFRLLLEDFMRPLREGLIEYKRLVADENYRHQATSLKKIGDLYVYNRMHIQNIVVDPNGIIYEAVFDVTPFKNYQWEVLVFVIFIFPTQITKFVN